MSIQEEIQLSEPSEYVELWELDLTMYGDVIYYFVLGAFERGDVVYDGQIYTPWDIKADGFEWSGQGEIPTPTITFASGTIGLVSLINAYNDLVGAKVTRTRTFRRFLDDGEDPSPTEHLAKDTFVINTKTLENKFQVQFELTSELDQQGVELPRGRITPYCRARYRRWNGTAFDYDNTDLACPYGIVNSGTAKFDSLDQPTADPALDSCSHNPNGCKARFGADAILPLMGFPGTQRPTV